MRFLWIPSYNFLSILIICSKPALLNLRWAATIFNFYYEHYDLFICYDSISFLHFYAFIQINLNRYLHNQIYPRFARQVENLSRLFYDWFIICFWTTFYLRFWISWIFYSLLKYATNWFFITLFEHFLTITFIIHILIFLKFVILMFC